MGRFMPPLYGDGLNYWYSELGKAIEKNDNEAIQDCLKQLALFIKNDHEDKACS